MNVLDFIVKLLADEFTKRRHDDGKALSGAPALGAVVKSHFHHLTLYNPLALITGIVFTATLFFPWWYAAVHDNAYTINAYAFILQHDLPPEGMYFIIETPRIAVALLIVLLAGYFFLVFWGSTMEGKKGRRFLIWSGVFMLLYTTGFYGSLLFATHRIGQAVTGYSYVTITIQVDTFMTFTRAYFVAIGAGAVCILSSLLHGVVPLKLYRATAGANDEI